MKKIQYFIFSVIITCTVSGYSQPIASQMPTGREFFIQSAASYGTEVGFWDIPGNLTSITKGLKIQLWEFSMDMDRKFTLLQSQENGFYLIKVGNTPNARVDIQGGKTDNGTPVQTWDHHGKENQRFLFQHLGDGRFKIFDYNSGRIICPKGESNSNGTQLNIQDDYNSSFAEWYLIDAQTYETFVPNSAALQEKHIANVSSSNFSSKVIYSLASGEDMVYGKVGLFDDGSVKYTFAVVRKPSGSKQIYKREIEMPYGPQPILSGGQMKIDSNPREYDFYDYYVIFNGQKMGPYDRIYDMHQSDGNVDNWVTPDGKYISFAAVKGEKYYPIIGNSEQIAFWSVLQAPDFDRSSGHATYAIAFGKNKYWLIEDGNPKLKDWPAIGNIKYASNGRDLLYVGSQNNAKEKYIYLNHRQIGGPFEIVSQLGFIPGTNKPFYTVFSHKTSNGTSEVEFNDVFLGDKVINIPRGEGVGKFYFTDSGVSFTRSKKNPSYDGKNMYKANFVTIYEYNFKTNQLKKLDGEYSMVSTKIADGTFFYDVNDSDGNSILVKQGGEVLEKVNKEVHNNGHGLTSFRLNSANGDYYSISSRGYNQPVVLHKNGKVFDIPNAPKIMFVERLNFSPVNKNLNMVLARDVPVGGNDWCAINGSNQFDFKGNATGVWTFSENGDVYSWMWSKAENDRSQNQLYKNGKLASDVKANSIVEFCVSPDGNRYATLVTTGDDPSTGGYYTENKYMHNKRRLFLDGEIVFGNFGVPVWSKQSNAFLVLKADRGKISLLGI
ncbi:MAG: RICIN domain-containing protein [Bacteroidales bacterium]